MKQTCILVLGMHRSGTSALTGILNLLNVYLGKDLMPANDANEKGYFENNILYKFNDKLLTKIDSSWEDASYNILKLETLSKQDIQDLKQIIRDEFKYSNIFAIKDPRLAYLFPIYYEVLTELNIDIKIILPYRNPIEVADSLNTRNSFSIEKSLLLWAYNLLLSEKFSRKCQRVFISFDELMSSPEDSIKLISDKLNLNLISKYNENRKEINDFLEPGLKHYNIAMDNLSSNIPIIIQKILELKDEFNDESVKKSFDVLYDELFNYQKLFYNEDTLSTYHQLKQAKATIIQEQTARFELEEALLVKTEEFTKEQTIRFELEEALHVKIEEFTKEQTARFELEEALHVKTEEFTKEQTARFELEEALHVKAEEFTQEQAIRLELEEALHVKAEEFTQEQAIRLELEEALLVKEKEISQIKDNHQNLITALQANIENLKDELVLIYTGKSWKITRPLRRIKRFFK